MENIDQLCKLASEHVKLNGFDTKYSRATPEDIEKEKSRVESNFKPRLKSTDPVSGSWLVSRTSPIGYYELFMYLESECIDFIIKRDDGSKKIITIYEFYREIASILSKAMFILPEDDELKSLFKWLHDFVFGIKNVPIDEELLKPAKVEKAEKKPAKEKKATSDKSKKAKPKTTKAKTKSTKKTTTTG